MSDRPRPGARHLHVEPAPPVRSWKDELAFRLKARRVRTPDRALAEIEKLETAGVEEIGTRVFVWPAPRGRVTGHFVGCEDPAHGAMPFLAKSRGAAHLAAARHIKAEHRGRGTVVLRERPISSSST